MRQITAKAVGAFVARTRMSSGNMQVALEQDAERGEHVAMRLHGNLIAYANSEGVTTLSDAGWQTTTTKERLNGLLRAIAPAYGIFQKNFEWFIQRDGETPREWNGTATFHNGELVS